MSLGLPSHLSRRANAHALASAARVAALVILVAAVVAVIAPGVTATAGGEGARQAVEHGRGAASASNANGLLLAFGVPWVGVIAILPLGAMLIALTRVRTVPLAVATLIIGMGSTFVYTLTLLAQNPSYVNSDLFVIVLPVIALTLVGGTGTGAMLGIIWASAGFFCGEVAVFASTMVAEREFRLSAISLGFYLMIVGVMALDGLSRNAQRGVQASILRTMRIEQSALARQHVEADAAAELHDTTLNQLALIASAPPGPLSAKSRERIQRDLAAWGRDRTAALERDADRAKTVEALWQASDLATAIEQARDDGLDVEVSGDRGVIGRLSAQSASALALAVRQCLVNVLRHSGQFSAQLALSSTAGEVSVMVLDAGRGFDEAAAAADRIGLQHSIRDRIERIGGNVVVFSAPGEGTSISIVVPAADVDRAGSAEGAS
jgi:signal transduction histidine kinase